MLRNVIAIVSGGSSGLGAATTTYLIRHGAKVVVADLPSSKDSYLRLAASASADRSLGGRETEGGSEKDPILAFSETDVRSEDDISRALDLAENVFGEPVNCSVSCAGIMPARKTISQSKSSPTTIRTHSLLEFTTAMDVNATGTFNLSRLAAQRMATRDPDGNGLRGVLVNTASIVAYEGQVGQVAYSASKGAVVGMTLPMARDLAPFGIRVMAIAPGLFKTPMLDSLSPEALQQMGDTVPCPKRLGDPMEFGQLVGSIVQNPMLNGEVIRLDGAYRMPP